MKLRFLKDYSTRKVGDFKEVDDSLADYLIGIGVAEQAIEKLAEKELKPVTTTKEEKAVRRTKGAKN